MSIAPSSLSPEPEYAWEVATLYPAQGDWSEADYLDLTDDTKRRIELADRRLEFLPMPTEIHQLLSAFLYHALYSFVMKQGLGTVHFSGLRVRLRPGNIREPDVVFLHKDHYHKRHNRVWDGADLAMEVVTDDPKDRDRDYQTKLADYAAGKIPEYWIIDPERLAVLVYRLAQDEYALHGAFSPGQQAASPLLDGFSVDVTALFEAIKDIPQ